MKLESWVTKWDTSIKNQKHSKPSEYHHESAHSQLTNHHLPWPKVNHQLTITNHSLKSCRTIIIPNTTIDHGFQHSLTNHSQFLKVKSLINIILNLTITNTPSLPTIITNLINHQNSSYKPSTIMTNHQLTIISNHQLPLTTIILNHYRLTFTENSNHQ